MINRVRCCYATVTTDSYNQDRHFGRMELLGLERKTIHDGCLVEMMNRFMMRHGPAGRVHVAQFIRQNLIQFAAMTRSNILRKIQSNHFLDVLHF